jgi:leader peptidase (prepilin peptidase)/N-methyltransferase
MTGPDGTAWLPLLIAPFVGSLLSVLVVRLPVGEPVVLSRSRCRHCGHRLSVPDLLPLVSWIALAGRCRHCRAPVGWLYPGLEAGALLIALWAVLIVPHPWLWPTCALGWTLLALAVIDVRHMLLPDALILPLLAAGLALCLLGGDGLSCRDRLIGAAIGLAVPLLIRALYRRLRGREGLGLGDAKLLAAAGAWLGWAGLPGVILIAAAAALVVELARAVIEGRLETRRPLPFGPYLCLAIWLIWLYGPLQLT